MNTGAFGEGFPYSNFHELNMDWIIKIAKDFLDQYSHIQETIQTGLDDLDEKATTLENALQAWYDEHSEDIAQELANALQDLNDWYTTHEGYLNQTLQDNITAFNTAADAKATTTIASIPDDYTQFYTDALKSLTLLGYANVVLTDANNAVDNSIYMVTTSNMSMYPANMPAQYSGFLITYHWKAYNVNQHFRTQIATDTNFNPLYVRTKVEANGSGSWTSWEDATGAGVLNNIFILQTNNLATKCKRVVGYYTDRMSGAIGTNANYEYIPVPVTAGTEYKLMNSKSATITFYSSDTFNTNTYVSGLLLFEGNFTAPEGATYASISHNKNEENLWMGIPSNYKEIGIKNDWKERQTITVKKDGSGDFNKLVLAINYAMNHKNTDIILGAGDWNIIEELGTDYFDNFEYHAYSEMGIKIGNGLHLIGSPKSRILCHYAGSNTQVKRYFSVFAAVADNVDGYGDFTLEGITIQASSIEYCVHDDVGIQTVPATHIYKNCSFSLDNSNNTTYGNHRGIGGGLGVQTTIEIKDSLFGGLGTTDDISLSYHNDNYSGDPKSSIIISGCCFTGRNTLEINALGNQTVKTVVKVSNNLLGTPLHKNVNGDVDNIELWNWNNETRYNN